METTRLSSKGQVIIPKSVRASHHWESGLELLVIDTGEGVLLKPKAPFEESTLDAVTGCLKNRRPAPSPGEVEEAIQKAVRREWRGRD
jgi:AbrB family looped-hinge helix DNA binding protein